MIHFRKAGQAVAIKDNFLSAARAKSSPAARNAVTELSALAVIGNFTSALKNLTSMAPTIYLALAGVEPMLIGFGTDGRLHVLLVSP